MEGILSVGAKALATVARFNHAARNLSQEVNARRNLYGADRWSLG
jgi:hypothetical protein